MTLVQLKRGKKLANGSRARKTRSRKAKSRCRAKPSNTLPRMARRLEQAIGGVRLAVDEIERGFQSLLAEARRDERHALVQGLAEAHILDYMLGLSEALDFLPPEAVPDSIMAMRDGPKALLIWLREKLQVEPWCRIGEVLLLDEAEMDQFEVVGHAENEITFPAKARVCSSGWRLKGGPINKPCVNLLSES